MTILFLIGALALVASVIFDDFFAGSVIFILGCAWGIHFARWFIQRELERKEMPVSLGNQSPLLIDVEGIKAEAVRARIKELEGKS